ncbi:efflux RND transporter periplasmic adaptor subunit [Palleronia rufa]|uniref:efflux RND transporter periplasmic adaptor subunit n=1 Tax=Palleronia rufa TaxID=1530186 RepID=UPI001F3D3042|nr:efflux RND transporter periplasmic adaptor subunit [Palleronia rufa]
MRVLNGTVRAAERAPLGFEVDGQVESVEVEIGDHFARGDVLATVNASTLSIQLDERHSALIEADANLTEAQQEFDRQTELYQRGVTPEARVEDAAARLDSARSRFAVAKSGIEQARDRLKDATLLAPYGGRVAARLIEPSQLVRAGEPAFEIQGDGGGYEIEVTIPETLISKVEIGSRRPSFRGRRSGYADRFRDTAAAPEARVAAKRKRKARCAARR